MTTQRSGNVVEPGRTSRRAFLQLAATGATFSTLSGANLPPRRLAAAEPAAPPLEPESDAALPTFREICPQHAELVLRRSRAEHQRIATSLDAAGARPVTVAACQMANHCDGERGKQTNLARMLRHVEAAAGQGAQVIAFPEMCLPGYLLVGTPAEAARINHALADVAGKSRALEQLARTAKQFGMVVAFGFCERSGDEYFNSIGLIDADGTWRGARRKNPLSPHPHETGSFTEPDPSLRSTVFETRYGTVGLANCFDGEFPESIRRMRLAGAELLLWCNAGTGNPELGHSARINSAGSYAQANRLWVVCCNAVAGNCYGTSVIVGPAGEPLVVLPPNAEALGVATINLALTADWDRWRSRLDPIWRERVRG